MSTIEKVNLGAELKLAVGEMRKSINTKVENLEEGVIFSQLFRMELYNSIKKMKNAGQEMEEDEDVAEDMENHSYVEDGISVW